MATRRTLFLSSFLALAAAATPSLAVESPVTTAMLQQASVSTEVVTRESGFVHRLYRPEKPSDRTIIMMHGSGGDETTLAALAASIAPDATLIGIRGRVVQNGVKRWYKRITPTEFDQQDVRAEADAFVSFLTTMAKEQDLDLSKVTFLGYSNGANLIAALSQLHPGVVRKAVLLRPMPVLAEAQQVDLSDSRFLTIAGENDKLYYPFAPKLETMLRGCGASVEARVIRSGHGIGEEDARIAAEWLGSPAK
jgi:phospholipase/carboxylesterase